MCRFASKVRLEGEGEGEGEPGAGTAVAERPSTAVAERPPPRNHGQPIGNRRWCGMALSHPPAVLADMADMQLLHDRARRRHGLLTIEDLRTAGVGDRQRQRWASTGRLLRVARGVYRMAGSPSTVESRLLAAVLARDSDTVVSHLSAAWLWELPRIGTPARIDVTRSVSRSGEERSGVVVHRSRHLPRHHQTVHRGVPVTTVSRTLLDLAAVVGPNLLDEIVEVALRTRFCSIGSLHRVLDESAGRGRPGTDLLRRVLTERGRGYVPTESELDMLGRHVVASIDGIEWQVELFDEQGYIRRVDGLHRASGLVIEWDGAEFHDLDRQRALDASQDARLEAIGLTVVRFRWGDVTRTPDEVRERILGHLARSRRDGTTPSRGAGRRAVSEGADRGVA